MQFFEKPHTYLAMLAISLKDTLAYKMDFIMGLVFRFAQVGLMIFIWTAIYNFTNTNSILGITLPMMYIYFFLINAFRTLINMNVPYIIQDDIWEGNITAAYTRPVRYPLQVFMDSFSDCLFSIIFIMLPLLLIAHVLFGASISAATALLVAAEIVIGYIMITIIGFMVGMIAVKLTNISGIIEALFSIILLLSGGFIPINFFPNVIFQVLLLTPFPIMLYIPAATFLGMASSSIIFTSIWVSLIWIVVLGAIATLAWSRTRKYITSAGG